MNKPIRNEEALYKTVDQMKQATNLCRSNVMKIANEAETVIRIGRAVRINSEKFYKYMDIVYKDTI